MCVLNPYLMENGHSARFEHSVACFVSDVILGVCINVVGVLLASGHHRNGPDEIQARFEYEKAGLFKRVPYCIP
jgi:hypothetical protein